MSVRSNTSPTWHWWIISI